MKRIGFIFEKIIDEENCKQAILKASKGKRSRDSVKRILDNIDFFATDLAKRLQSGNFISVYTSRIITDGLSKKERELLIPKFYPDQCAHHAIMNILMPIVEKSSYRWSCANIKGRGMDAASKHICRITMSPQEQMLYCLKFDIKKFFPSISHDVLKQKIRHKIKDQKALHLLDLIIDSVDIGIPIGNYTSPAFAEFMLFDIDHLILSHKAVLSYTRYADDFVIIGKSKDDLRDLFDSIKIALSKVDLEIKSNYQIFPITTQICSNARKIDFVGKCFAIGYTTVRKRRSLAFMRQSRYIQRKSNVNFKTAAGFLSRCNLFRYTDSFMLKKKYLDPVNVERLKQVIRDNSLAHV